MKKILNPNSPEQGSEDFTLDELRLILSDIDGNCANWTKEEIALSRSVEAKVEAMIKARQPQRVSHINDTLTIGQVREDDLSEDLCKALRSMASFIDNEEGLEEVMVTPFSLAEAITREQIMARRNEPVAFDIAEANVLLDDCNKAEISYIQLIKH